METIIEVRDGMSLRVDERGLWVIRGRDGYLHHLGEKKYIKRVWQEWIRGNMQCRNLCKKYRKIRIVTY